MAIDNATEARALANKLIDDARTYGGAGADLSEARTLFQERVAPALHGVFDEAAAPSPSRAVSPEMPRKARWATLVVLVVVFVPASYAVATCRPSGDKIGRIPIPGSLVVEAGMDDEFQFTADTDVLSPHHGRTAVPTGCHVDVELVADGKTVASTSCDLFKTTRFSNSVVSSSRRDDPKTGHVHLTLKGQRLGCDVSAPRSGRITVKVSSNVATCVPKSFGATAEVYRKRNP